MNSTLIIYPLPILFVILIAGFIAYYSRRHRDIAGTKAFMWAALFVVLLAVFQGLSIFGPTKQWSLVWFELRFIFLASAPVLWLIFIMQFSGISRWISKGLIAGLFIVPAVTQIIIWSNPIHNLWVKQPVGFRQEGVFFVVQTALRIPGPWIWVHYIYSFALVAAGLTILAVVATRTDRRGTGQIVTVGLGTIVMAVASLFPGLGLITDDRFNPLLPGLAVGMAIIFWGIYRYQFLRTPLLFKREERTPIVLVGLFLLLTIGILTAGYGYFKHYERSYRAEFDSLLSSVADLKVRELVQWRRERLGDAAVLFGNNSFTQLIKQVIVQRSDITAKQHIRTWMGKIQGAYQYKNVLLLDSSGALVFSVFTPDPSVCDQIKNHILGIQPADQPDFLDFHRETENGSITLSVLIPIFDKNSLLGTVALIIDPTIYLYPMISSWPTHDQTAETLLVRRDGDEVVFLNELKFRTDFALDLRFPLSQENLPAARAARGEEGVMEGIDYRGIPVIAALRSIPDSPWFMVARIDKKEIYGPVWKYLWFIVLLVFSLIGGAGTGVLLLWKHQKNLYDAFQLEAQKALLENKNRLREAQEMAHLGFWSWDVETGKVIWSDEVYKIFGLDPQEFTPHIDSILALSPWPEDQKRDKELIRRALENHNPGYYEQKFLHPDKSIGYYYSTFQGNYDDRGGLISIMGTVMDITERKIAEEKVLLAHERLRRLIDSNIIGVVIARADGRIIEANDYYLNLIGYTREEFDSGKVDWRAITPPEWLLSDEKAIRELRELGSCPPYEKEYQRRDGSRISVFLANAILPGSEEEIAAFIVDITERKKAENEIRRLNENLEQRIGERTAELKETIARLEELNRSFVGRELKMAELKARIAELEQKDCGN